VPVLAVALVAGLTLAGETAAAPAAKPTLTVSKSQKVQIVSFGDSRDPKPVNVPIDVLPRPSSKPSTPAVAVRGDLVSEQGNRLSGSQVKVKKVKYNGLGGFDVGLEIDPDGTSAGRYTGTVQFGGPGYARVLPVTIEATLKKHWTVAFLIVLVGWLAGVLAKAAVDLYKAPGEKVSSSKSFRRWILRSGFFAVAVAGLAAGVAAGLTAYLSNPIWGADGADLGKLFGATFTAVVTGTTLADVKFAFTSEDDKVVA
jgi:hypothetical protein